MRKTKIVATLGPSTSTYENILQLIVSGMDVARVNFSHGDYNQHSSNIKMLRKASQKTGRSIAILQDLQGLKIRTGNLENSHPVSLQKDQEFIITAQECIGNINKVSVNYKKLPTDVKPGNRILLSDGLIELQVKSVKGEDIHCIVISSGILREKQGINVPNVHINAPSITTKDYEDLKYGLENGVDYVALSFIRSSKDIIKAKEYIASLGFDTPVVAKLERPEAIADLDNILKVTDAIMIARGDLGVELAPEKLPVLQKSIISKANAASVPVITATQMLESMISNKRPTRAEVTDVANAIIDGTDAVMLSAETAAGKYPFESVQMMHKIACEIEKERKITSDISFDPQKFAISSSVPDSIGAAVSAIIKTHPIRAILVHTMSGSTARLIAHYRPNVPIFAFTPEEKVQRRLNLIWNVQPFLIKYYKTFQDLNRLVKREIKKYKLANNNDFVIVTGGHPIGESGPTNFLKIQQVDLT